MTIAAIKSVRSLPLSAIQLTLQPTPWLPIEVEVEDEAPS
jgi:hypothetical protein